MQFGHGLQHLLTTVEYSDVAGLSFVEWDAVFICDYFMENWYKTKFFSLKINNIIYRDFRIDTAYWSSREFVSSGLETDTELLVYDNFDIHSEGN